MMQRARAAQYQVIKFAIDGKQNVLSSLYTVATLSFLVSSEHVSLTRDGRARSASRPKLHTLAQEPFAQALLSSESEENVSQFLLTTADMAKACCDLDVQNQVWQLQRALRPRGVRYFLQHARAMITRACAEFRTNTWKSFWATTCRPNLRMRAGVCARSLCFEEYFASKDAEGACHDPELRQEVQVCLTAISSGAHIIITVGVVTRLGRRDHQGRELKTCVPRSTGSWRMQEAFRRLDAIVRLSRTLPTIALFDVVWRLTFAWLQSISKKAATYLQQTYFQKTQCMSATQWVAAARAGLLASGLASRVHTQGSGCGTQPLESFHAYWQSAARSQARAAPTEIFNVIQKIYKKDWSQKFKWGEKRSFLTWPDRPAQDLLNSQTLGGRPRLISGQIQARS